MHTGQINGIARLRPSKARVVALQADARRGLEHGWRAIKPARDASNHSSKLPFSMPRTLLHLGAANVKRWGTGVRHDFRKDHLERHLQEIVLRWNRWRRTRVAFDSLLGIAAALHLSPTVMSSNGVPFRSASGHDVLNQTLRLLGDG